MKFNKVYFALLMLLAIASQSCTDMNDLTDKYLDEGEIVYAAKVDSVGVRAGGIIMKTLSMSRSVERLVFFLLYSMICRKADICSN